MFGNAIDPCMLPQDAVILQPHWQYTVKRSGTRRSRLCCNGSKNAAPELHAVASTWSLCCEQPVQRLDLGLCAHYNFKIFEADLTDAYAHAPKATTPTYLKIDDTYASWYRDRFGKEIDKRKVLPVEHSLQGHPESGSQWMKMIDNVLIDQLGFTTTKKKN